MAPRLFPRLSCSALGLPPWAPPALHAKSTLPPATDVVVVGAGLTGLSAALALASIGREVVVIEDAFGTGATARSGGVVLGQTLVGPHPQFDGCELDLRQWIDASGIDCGLAWQGCLELVRNDALPPSPIDWRDSGTIRFSKTVEGGVLDPARLLAGLASVAVQAGVRLVTDARVLSAESGAEGLQLETARGRISAREGVCAADAMLAPNHDPWDERAITVSLQTLPLEEGTLAAIGLKSNQAFYTDDLPLLWGRVMPDQSLLVGREVLPPAFDAPPQALSASVSAAGARLLERARGLHPAMDEVGLKRVWGGPIARTTAGVPIVRRDVDHPRLIWAGGYGGHGIAQAFRVGRLVAELLA